MITLTLKIMLVVLLVYMGIQMVKKAIRNWIGGLLGRGELPKQETKLVLSPCAHCGLQVAAEIGLTRKGHFYCSEPCASEAEKPQ